MTLYENKITLRGFIGRNAESKITRQQRGFVILSLATKSGYKDRQTSEWVNHTEWHRVVAFGKAADSANGLKKGDYVEVEGELRSLEFDAEAGDGGTKVRMKRRGWEVRAGVVRKLAPPARSTGNLETEPADGESAA